ncbi:type I-B CRISPR-associated protein Cas5 [Methanosarcina sp. DH2]|jgi:CRISPR-associated protein Cas5h|uniref:type I-B CRISPR-associated protein Cas5b n=1 Tax=Methanosarcina sp. DH2 TaxID=2605639 RepID=UPI001E51CB50|nr:type I-B CRISPR-associated protein Cas5b [Methanosarcina sp. DH2]MCC4769309.1 type I-B CRISPR-associated protein Cas5 [Methanosarcina sp. DH2]
MDCLVFRAKSGYAKFRKPYTTTSALTFLCIHPPAVKGLIGAVMGIDKTEIYRTTLDLRIGIQVLSPVRKDMQVLKLVSMKAEKDLFNFPVNAEFLRDPEYRIFISWLPDKLDELEKRLMNQSPVFTPYLGVSEYIAKLVYENRCNVEIAGRAGSVESIIPSRFIKLQHSDYQMFTDNIPVCNNEKREYTSYEKILFAFKKGNPCSLIGDLKRDVYKVDDNNIFFFE